MDGVDDVRRVLFLQNEYLGCLTWNRTGIRSLEAGHGHRLDGIEDRLRGRPVDQRPAG